MYRVDILDRQVLVQFLDIHVFAAFKLAQRRIVLETVVARDGSVSAVTLIEGDSEVGGGSFPGTKLRTWLAGFPDESLAERLQRCDPPIIARVAGNRVLLDARTILPGQVETVIAALRADR